MKQSDKLFLQLRLLQSTAANSIADIMRTKGITVVNLAKDDNGLHPGDDGYDIDAMMDRRVYVDIYGKHGIEEGYISSVKIEEGSPRCTVIGTDSNCEYSDDFIVTDAYLWASILDWMERYLK